MLSKKSFDFRRAIGIFIIFVGGLLILQNFNIVDFNFSRMIFNWCSILIILGLIILATSSNISGGLILITIGMICHLPELWPVVLIVIGLYIILRVRESSIHTDINESKSETTMPGYKIDEVAVFGGGKKLISVDNFNGGKITTIFGGFEINLLDSKLAEGESKIELFAMFGGTTIFVPSDWEVKLDVISIFGGFSDSRKFLTKSSISASKILIVKGLVLFGGGEIKN